MNRLFIGNPGVGKSTIVNCLAQKVIFQGGVSYGSGLTYKLDIAVVEGVKYMDTPGLSDPEKRKQAAEAITEALRQNGSYQVFFVVTLQSGRVHAEDLATMKLVLESAEEITSYNVIINKISPNVHKDLTDKTNPENLEKIVCYLNIGIGSKRRPPSILLLQRNDKLDDAKNKFIHLPELHEFVEIAPQVVIFPQNVTDIPGGEAFDRAVGVLEEQLTALREDNNRLRITMEQNEERYKKQVEEMEDSRRKIDRTERLEQLATQFVTHLVPVLAKLIIE